MESIGAGILHHDYRIRILSWDLPAAHFACELNGAFSLDPLPFVYKFYNTRLTLQNY